MKKLTALSLITLFLFILLFFASNANATEFSQTYLRLDRAKTNTALSGLVCAKPSTAGAGTEAKISITFPSDFTLNSDTSNWSTSTANLPSGATAWPDIGTNANSVSGQIVTFSGGDLTSASALYCFNFTASSSTTGATGDKTGNITTKNSVNTSIDSSDYGLTIVSNDQIIVSATVPADPNDFTDSITQITSGTTFNQNEEIEFQINYGSSLTYAASLTVIASWSQGTISGQGSPSVDILEYVTGSAGNAYGSTPPVIDTVNRTITWSISSFPASTLNQTVNFKLKTTSGYTGSSNVGFTVSEHLEPSGTSTPENSISLTYSYSSPITPTPTSTPTPASTSTSTTATSTSTPTPTQSPIVKPKFQKIEIREISQISAFVFITTSKETKKTVKYGKVISALNQSINTSLTKASLATLNDLETNTRYYFQITAVDSSGNKITSDIYTFKTASSPFEIFIDENSLIVVSNQSILSMINQSSSVNIPIIKNNFLVIPKKTMFKFKFFLKNRALVKNIQVILRNKKILEASENLETIETIEIESGAYEGTLTTRPALGNYEIIAQINDINGNIIEQKLSDLKIINKFTVLNKKNKNPIEGAKVVFYIYNQANRLYKKIPSLNLENGNPAFTNSKGKINIVLPQAKYKVEISDLRYQDQQVEFVIGPDENSDFPIIYMEPEKITIFRLIGYYLKGFNDVFLYNTVLYAGSLRESIRFFDLLAMLILLSLALVTLASFSRKHLIPISSIHSYFYYLLNKKVRNEKYIHGVIYNEDDKPISLVNVYLTDKNSEEIVSNTTTNSNGEFYFTRGNSEYLIMVMKKGFKTTPLVPYEEKDYLKFKITLQKDDAVTNFKEKFAHTLASAFGVFFEVFMMTTLIFEILFLTTFGLAKTLPFLVISVFNLILWILHLRHKPQEV